MTTIRGIAGHPGASAYVQEAYGVSRAGSVGGLPVFKEKGERYFAGGYKNLYSVVLGDEEETLRVLASWRREKRYVRYGFSTDEAPTRAKRAHYLLTVPAGVLASERYALYRGKTRNQVKKAARLISDARVEARPDAFYDLYRRSIKRLGSAPRPLAWFTTFERHFGLDARVVSAYSGGALLAANYFVRHGDYALLLFNVSDSAAWPLAANDLVYDEYVRFCIEQNVRFIDFGPGMKKDRSHAHFKEGFGGAPRSFIDTLYAPLYTRLAEIARGRLPGARRKLARIFSRR